MPKASDFFEVISGRRRGPKAALLRGLLSLLEVPYRIAVAIRNRRFDRNSKLTTDVSVPVIAVGNLTTGGTGKTPMVLWISKWFRQEGVRVCLLSRGYGAQRGSVNDEALELEQRLPDVPHLQDPDRVAMAQIAIEELESELILLDDAFQHRKIGRDLNIVLLDALEPFGYGHLLPRGLLREPIANIRRADFAVLTRCDMVSPETREEIHQRVQKLHPTIGWAEATHQANSLLSQSGDAVDLEGDDARRVKKVLAFCGIGNPSAFQHSLTEQGMEVVAFREFPDHYRYQREDIENLNQWTAEHSDVDAVICTHKDLVKLQINQLGSTDLYAMTISIKFIRGEADLAERLRQVFRSSRIELSDANLT